MKNDKSRPAVKMAFDFLIEKLKAEEWHAGERLPSSRKLAADAGVTDSMLRAITLLKSQGLLTVIARGRIRAGDTTSQETTLAPQKRAAWLLKRAALEKDLLSGFYAEGRLPRFKELQVRYGVCFRTMHKILRAMVSDGVLELQGKSYRIKSSHSRTSSQRIVFITYHVQTVPQSALNPGEYRILDILERECISRGLKLEVVEIDFYSAIETRRSISSAAVNNPALGYILDIWWYPGEEFQRSHHDLLLKLETLKRPVSILDEIGNFVLPLPFASSPLYQVFRIEGKRAGARLARIFLEMGHRSVVFISSLHEFQWSKQRLEGVLDEYAKAGCSGGVKVVTGKNIEINHEEILSISGFDNPLVKKILAVNGTKGAAEQAFKAFLRFRDNFSPDRFTPEEINEIKKNLSVIKDLADREISTPLFNRICYNILTQEIGAVVATKVSSPLFERALKYHEAKAWICATDGMALSALSHLQKQKIAVPRDISIAGFDNTPVKALEQRLTSFDFNAGVFVHRMLNHIARPPKPRGPYRHAAIEVEGVVMVRDTTGSP